MNVLLTAAAFVMLVAVGACVIHRLNTQHADRIAARRYGAAPPGRGSSGGPQPPAETDRSKSSVGGERRDRRDEGPARFPPGRKRRDGPR